MIVVTVAVSCDTCGMKFDTEAHFSSQVEGTLYLEHFGYWEVVQMAEDAGWTLKLADFAIYCPLHGPDDEVQIEPHEGEFRPTTVTVDRDALSEQIEQLAGSTSWVFHSDDLSELDDAGLVNKLDVLKRLLAILNRRQALIKENNLTADDCLIAAVFGPNTTVEHQIDIMNADLRGLALQFNGGESLT